MTLVSKDQTSEQQVVLCTPIKVQLQTRAGDIEYRRLKLENATAEFSALESKLRSAFSIAAASRLQLEYRDDDAEWILFSSTSELLLALDQVNGGLLRVRLSLHDRVPSPSPSPSPSPAASPLSAALSPATAVSTVSAPPTSALSPSIVPDATSSTQPSAPVLYPNVEDMPPSVRQQYIRGVFERDAVSPIGEDELNSLPPRVAMRIRRRREKQQRHSDRVGVEGCWRQARQQRQQQQQQQQQFGPYDDPTQNNKLRVHALLVRDVLSHGAEDLTGMPVHVQKRVHSHRIKRVNNPMFGTRFLSKWTPILLREAPHMLPVDFVTHQPADSAESVSAASCSVVASASVVAESASVVAAAAQRPSSQATGCAHCQCDCHQRQQRRASITFEDVCRVDDERTIPQEVLRLLPQEYIRAVRKHRATRASEAGSPIGRICRLDDEHPLADELLDLMPNHVSRAVRAHREKVLARLQEQHTD
mmetsp:Transcript_38316/g.96395  ORF Transcript_38316/g.96395 Transcript_38316/m.96395 type:complete len:476 (+) Transcript_38316:237-1664(+)